MKVKNKNILMYSSDNTLSLGCLECPDLAICGGIRVPPGVINCMDFCLCDEISHNHHLCPNNTSAYVKLLHKVNGFEFGNIPRAKVLPTPELPIMIPWIKDGSSRKAVLDNQIVAVPLKQLFSYEKRTVNYSSKKDVSDAFRFGLKTDLIIDSTSEDQPLEDYWSIRHSAGLINQIASLNPKLVVSPNFSLFNDVPRQDNLYNMKRIILCWQELIEAGIPTALQINARTDRDWERWTEFVKDREEVRILACEFATGGRVKVAADWYIKKLLTLVSKVEHPLHLIVRGIKHISKLLPGFQSVSVLDTTPFLKTMKRQHLEITTTGQMKSQPVITLANQPLDDLLYHNINIREYWIKCKIQQAKICSKTIVNNHSLVAS